jgi:hypothetical protein
VRLSSRVPIGRSRTAKPSHALRSSESRSFKRAPALAAANRSRPSAASRPFAANRPSAVSQAGSVNPAAPVEAARSEAVRGPADGSADNQRRAVAAIVGKTIATAGPSTRPGTPGLAQDDIRYLFAQDAIRYLFV